MVILFLRLSLFSASRSALSSSPLTTCRESLIARSRIAFFSPRSGTVILVRCAVSLFALAFSALTRQRRPAPAHSGRGDLMSPASARRTPGPVDALYDIGPDFDPHLPCRCFCDLSPNLRSAAKALPRPAYLRGEQSIRRSRSEERRVGKECRSRWSPYH